MIRGHLVVVCASWSGNAVILSLANHWQSAYILQQKRVRHAALSWTRQAMEYTGIFVSIQQGDHC